MPAPSAVSLTRVSRHFGTVRALDQVDLEIVPGEFFAMLGPSGSGKTTCLRLIAGFEQPSGGTIAIFGEDATGVPPYRRAVNTVFQDYALFPHLDVRANVAYSLMLRKVGKAERNAEAEAALEMVRLAGYGDRKPAQLSGGQRQRVALARALVNRPKVLLLDEPLGALDLKLRESMQDELKSLQRRLGITFVFVTHDQSEALSMADRVAVFDAGKIRQIGTPEEIYRRPATRFVADFVGSSNVLPPDLVEAIAGERRWASLRPEAIRLVAPEAAAPHLVGRLTTRSFLGATTRLGIDLGGLALHAIVPAETAVTLDAPVGIAFDRTALHLMEPEA
ncbi:ABC transporter ATP-binding protein [Aureimonas sp. SA4125]|uniref:ABC transporter ATP-binding protein n=1 Tax=Aureimonas sp. SA4125 TaxID=2826993 RepID=UPI001CC64CB2|nr:ABC transporter ATP-binding protein [Aureimonas sp. SA4125]